MYMVHVQRAQDGALGGWCVEETRSSVPGHIAFTAGWKLLAIRWLTLLISNPFFCISTAVTATLCFSCGHPLRSHRKASRAPHTVTISSITRLVSAEQAQSQGCW